LLTEEAAYVHGARLLEVAGGAVRSPLDALHAV
jgi:hypothetical protein